MSLRTMLATQLARRSVAVTHGRRLGEHVLMAFDDGSRISVVCPGGTMQIRLRPRDDGNTDLVLERQGGSDPETVLATGTVSSMTAMRDALSDQLLPQVRQRDLPLSRDSYIISGLFLVVALLLGLVIALGSAPRLGQDGASVAQPPALMAPPAAPSSAPAHPAAPATLPGAPQGGGDVPSSGPRADVRPPGGAVAPAQVSPGEAPSQAAAIQAPTGPLTREQTLVLARQVTEAIAANEPVPEEVLALLPPPAAAVARRLIAERANMPADGNAPMPPGTGSVSPGAASSAPAGSQPGTAAIPSSGPASGTPAPAAPASAQPAAARSGQPGTSPAAPPPPIDPPGRNASGISNVPPEGSWLRVSPRTEVPIPGGGDLTSMDQVREFGLQP